MEQHADCEAGTPDHRQKEREVRTMKRWAKAWLAVGVGCCVCGAALTGIGVASGGSKYVKSADLNKMDGAAKKAIMKWFLKKQSLMTLTQ